jgi:gamma-glutamyltranspeptidase/glutathione hydrolase
MQQVLRVGVGPRLTFQIPLDDLNSVTVPCAAAGWLKTVETYGSGKLTMREILEPAIRLAKEGVPEYEVNARSVCLQTLLVTSDHADE